MIGVAPVFLSFVLAVMVCECSTWAATGSVYRSRCTHVGVRPASDGLDGFAMTVQVTADLTGCAK